MLPKKATSDLIRGSYFGELLTRDNVFMLVLVSSLPMIFKLALAAFRATLLVSREGLDSTSICSAKTLFKTFIYLVNIIQ